MISANKYSVYPSVAIYLLLLLLLIACKNFAANDIYNFLSSERLYLFNRTFTSALLT